MKIERPSETTLFKAIYKKRETDPSFILVEEEQIHPFFTQVPHEGVTVDDLAIIRDYKNKLAKMRDKYVSDSNVWTLLNDELKRVIAFLEQDVFK